MAALSVIVPVYNGEEFLEVCIDSLVRAMVSDCEIILVDDGSTDQSGQICDKYADEFENIKVIHQQNSGVIFARKAGVSNADGEYITFVDCDDWVDADMYKDMLAKAREHMADVVICDMIREFGRISKYIYNNVDEGLYDGENLKSRFYPTMLFDFDICSPGICPSLCNKLIRRELLKKVIFDVDDSIVFGEDALCSYSVMLDADRIYVLKKNSYHYRQNFASVTNVYDKMLLKKFLLLHDEIRRQFDERGFDDGDQLKGYVANFSLNCIRMELLNKSYSMGKRKEIVRNYISDPRVDSSIDVMLKRIKDKKIKTKLKMVKAGQLLLLYFLFSVKERILKIKGDTNEN